MYLHIITLIVYGLLGLQYDASSVDSEMVTMMTAASEPVAFPRTPFGIHQHGEPILEGHIPELRVFQLDRKLLCHDAHANLSELTNRFVTEHYFFPLL